MTSPDEMRAKILASLKHGPLLLQELADEINEAPFTVDAYLKEMRRKQLVESWSWRGAPETLRLTSAGENAAAAAAQMRLA